MAATQCLLHVETHIRQLSYHSIKMSMKALVDFQHTARHFRFSYNISGSFSDLEKTKVNSE